MKNQEVIILSVISLLGVLFLYSQCTISCRKEEDYRRLTLTEDGPMKRSPVKTAFKGDGMSGNPHYQADPADELVPLEYGGVDFYQDERKLIRGDIHKETGECYRYRDEENTHLINDSKTRHDLVSSGEVGWHRLLHNLPHDAHAESRSAGSIEPELATADPRDFDMGLYHPQYHRDHVGN